MVTQIPLKERSNLNSEATRRSRLTKRVTLLPQVAAGITRSTHSLQESRGWQSAGLRCSELCTPQTLFHTYSTYSILQVSACPLMVDVEPSNRFSGFPLWSPRLNVLSLGFTNRLWRVSRAVDSSLLSGHSELELSYKPPVACS